MTKTDADSGCKGDTLILLDRRPVFPLILILTTIYVQLCHLDVERIAQQRDPHLSIAFAGREAPGAGRGVK